MIAACSVLRPGTLRPPSSTVAWNRSVSDRSSPLWRGRTSQRQSSTRVSMNDWAAVDLAVMSKSVPVSSAVIVQRRSVSVTTVVEPSNVTGGRPSSDSAAATS